MTKTTKPPVKEACRSSGDEVYSRCELNMPRSVPPFPSMSISRRSFAGFDAIIRTQIQLENPSTAEPATWSRTIPEKVADPAQAVLSERRGVNIPVVDALTSHLTCHGGKSGGIWLITPFN